MLKSKDFMIGHTFIEMRVIMMKKSFFMHENKVFELVQIEQQKLIADNTDVTEIQSQSGCWYFGVDKSTIINENNIIR